MRHQGTLTLYKNSCLSGLNKTLASIVGTLFGMCAAMFLLILLHEHDDYRIDHSQIHPFSILAAVISAMLVKNVVYKLCCSKRAIYTTTYLLPAALVDKARSIITHYIIPSVIGVLFGYFLSLVLTAFIPDDEDILNHSCHLLSSGIAAGTSTILSDLSQCCCLKTCLGWEDTRPRQTHDESTYLYYPSINSV